MNKRVTDLTAFCICLAAIGIVLLYPEQVRGRETVLVIAGILAVVFLILAVQDGRSSQEAKGGAGVRLPSESDLVTEIVLLSEEDSSLMSWDLYGKTAIVIGRDVKENQVDIDLSGSPYASMVDIEHAVLNFSAGSWYVEDLGSSNGISIKKAGDQRLYRLSADTPCRLERGDCIYVGLNRLILK